MKINHFGTLYIVATPIGNVDDVTIRALDILKNVDLIAAEDTRHSLPFLKHHGIQKKIISLHEHNEEERTAQLLKILQEGQSIALISDAGTPLISDPGYILVQRVLNENIKISPIPGPCAAIAALSASGLATTQFVFEGFLPTKTRQRQERLQQLSTEARTIIFYEAPHRIVAFITLLADYFGENRRIVLAREVTKMFETFLRGSLKEVLQSIEEDKNQTRGEMVVLVEGLVGIKADQNTEVEITLTELLKVLPLKQAVSVAEKLTGARKNFLYEQALILQKK